MPGTAVTIVRPKGKGDASPPRRRPLCRPPVAGVKARLEFGDGIGKRGLFLECGQRPRDVRRGGADGRLGFPRLELVE